MLKALDAIAEVNPDVQPVGDVTARRPGRLRPGTGAPAPAGRPRRPGADGFVPDIVVLLTDGANTRGIAPLDAVPYAVERRVRVYTIGFGTTQPTTLVVLGAAARRRHPALRRRRFGGGGGGGGGGGSPLRADDDTLQQVADETGGTCLPRRGRRPAAQGVRRPAEGRHRPEAAPARSRAPFVALGALLAAAAIGASIRWSPYP